MPDTKTATRTVVKDPVCGMELEQAQAAGMSMHEGQTYYFCSKDCKDQFDRNPSAYVSRADSRQRPNA